MRVLLNTTRMRMKSLQYVNRRKSSTLETCARARKRAPRNTITRAWHNWLMEENYL